MSVVDGSLKVYGVDNLRIADGSILPRVTTGNTMAPCVVIGERAAEAVRTEHKLETSSVSRSARLNVGLLPLERRIRQDSAQRRKTQTHLHICRAVY